MILSLLPITALAANNYQIAVSDGTEGEKHATIYYVHISKSDAGINTVTSDSFHPLTSTPNSFESQSNNTTAVVYFVVTDDNYVLTGVTCENKKPNGNVDTKASTIVPIEDVSEKYKDDSGMTWLIDLVDKMRATENPLTVGGKKPVAVFLNSLNETYDGYTMTYTTTTAKVSLEVDAKADKDTVQVNDSVIFTVTLNPSAGNGVDLVSTPTITSVKVGNTVYDATPTSTTNEYTVTYTVQQSDIENGTVTLTVGASARYKSTAFGSSIATATATDEATVALRPLNVTFNGNEPNGAESAINVPTTPQEVTYGQNAKKPTTPRP
jgi:hypothetical protein